MALLDAFLAALIAIFAKMGLQNVDSNIATMVRTAIMMVFMVLVMVLTGKAGSVEKISFQRRFVYSSYGIAGLLYFAALRMAMSPR